MATFTIRAQPGTDIWRKPPHTKVFNAPTAAPPSGAWSATSSTGRLTDFVSARISFSATWVERYDQGGLLLAFRRRGSSSSTSTASASASDGDTAASPPAKWIKTGVEFYTGRPLLSTVACDAWADWSVAPLTTTTTPTTGSGGGDAAWTTVTAEKEEEDGATSLWVYQVLDSGEKIPLREVCWVYGDEPGEWDLEVLAMAARPEKKAGGALEVQFRDMEVKWAT